MKNVFSPIIAFQNNNIKVIIEIKRNMTNTELLFISGAENSWEINLKPVLLWYNCNTILNTVLLIIRATNIVTTVFGVFCSSLVLYFFMRIKVIFVIVMFDNMAGMMAVQMSSVPLFLHYGTCQMHF